jgi:hypothetical protein
MFAPSLDERGARGLLARLESAIDLNIDVVTPRLTERPRGTEDARPSFVKRVHDGRWMGKKENTLAVIRRYADLGLQLVTTFIDSDLPAHPGQVHLKRAVRMKPKSRVLRFESFPSAAPDLPNA